MERLIHFCLNHIRTIFLLLGFIFVAGYYAYVSIPKESYPDITIPVVMVHLVQKGIAPQDSERLLLRPMEVKLQTIEGLKEMRGTAFEGGGMLVLEFQAGLDIDKIIQDVRREVDMAKVDLPVEAEEPKVDEINLSLFPVLVIHLTGNVPERTLYHVAETLKEKIEGLSQILKSPIFGKREEIVETIVDPVKLETYGMSLAQVRDLFKANHMIIPSGALSNGSGSFNIKVPGLLETVEDIQEMPLFAQNDVVVKFKDVAKIQSSFYPHKTFSRDNGRPSVSLEVSKRLGQNIIETIDAVRDVVDEESKKWGGKIQVTFAQDGSQKIQDMLHELQNSIITAILLVMVVMIFAMGMRSSILVGLAIPGAFLMGILIITWLGLTLNIVVLFSLILSVGMLVDGAIIVVEYADRKMIEGKSVYKAYLEASTRMAWPVITSLTTIIVVFMPLLYWPGLIGEFMKFLPITLIATLTSSLLMALIFIPALGVVFGRATARSKQLTQSIIQSERGNLADMGGFTGWYIKLLSKALQCPGRIVFWAFILLVGIFIVYKFLGQGVEFFPNIEPEKAAYLVHARGNLSIEDKDKLVKKVEDKLLPISSFKNISSKTGHIDQAAEDVIGKIMVEFTDWKTRPHANQVLQEGFEQVKTIPGIKVEIDAHKAGPVKGKPISLQIIGRNEKSLNSTLDHLRSYFDSHPALKDIEDNTPIPALEWQIKIDRAKALQYGANVAMIGNAVQLLTRGMQFSTYRPDNARDEIDIVARYPLSNRSLQELYDQRVKTSYGNIPLRNFVSITPKQKVGKITRVNGSRYLTLEANLKPGFLVDNIVKELQAWLDKEEIAPDVTVKFKGEEEDKQETSAFLGKAFCVAIFLILLILVTQFNSFFSAFLVLTAVVFSTFGVLVGLMLTQQPFGIVMGGLGIIALAGIIVSNNIIFIDTFDLLRKDAKTLEQRKIAILRTGAQRMRPVILTKLTTILGLFPILMSMDIDYFNGAISFGSPSTEWWILLSTCIVFGVAFASVLTLILTPCALMIRENIRARKLKRS